MDSSVSGKAGARRGPFIGRPLPRFEDLRLVRGAGRYTDDLWIAGQAYAVFVRAPHAHARIDSIDASAARDRPGVLAVLTGADYAAYGHIGRKAEGDFFPWEKTDLVEDLKAALNEVAVAA